MLVDQNLSDYMIYLDICLKRIHECVAILNN